MHPSTRLYLLFSPVLYSRLSLVICFMLSSAYESIPVSQCIPLPFPDLVPTCLFSASMSLSASELKSCASLVAQMAKNLPAMQEIQVQSVGQEDPLEKGMATHSSILAGES